MLENVAHHALNAVCKWDFSFCETHSNIPLTQSAATLATTTLLLLQMSWLSAVTLHFYFPLLSFVFLFLVFDWLSDCHQTTCRWRHGFHCVTWSTWNVEWKEGMDLSNSDWGEMRHESSSRKQLDLSSKTATSINNVKCLWVECQYYMWSKSQGCWWSWLRRRQQWGCDHTEQAWLNKFSIHTFVFSLLSLNAKLVGRLYESLAPAEGEVRGCISCAYLFVWLCTHAWILISFILIQ